MMKITVKQIRAARALLGWSQQDLASKAGMSLPAINTLEREVVNPRYDTVQAIQAALENGGIEFLNFGGVREKTDILEIKMWEGPEALEELFADLWRSKKDKGGIILVNGVEEERFLKINSEALLDFIEKLKQHGKIKAKLLVREGDRSFVGTPRLTQYRWLPEQYFSFVPHYVYEDKHAVVLWGPPVRVIITKNKSLAQAYRKQFAINWHYAKEPPPGLHERRITDHT